MRPITIKELKQISYSFSHSSHSMKLYFSATLIESVLILNFVIAFLNTYPVFAPISLFSTIFKCNATEVYPLLILIDYLNIY